MVGILVCLSAVMKMAFLKGSLFKITCSFVGSGVLAHVSKMITPSAMKKSLLGCLDIAGFTQPDIHGGLLYCAGEGKG